MQTKPFTPRLSSFMTTCKLVMHKDTLDALMQENMLLPQITKLGGTHKVHDCTGGQVELRKVDRAVRGLKQPIEGYAPHHTDVVLLTLKVPVEHGKTLRDLVRHHHLLQEPEETEA